MIMSFLLFADAAALLLSIGGLLRNIARSSSSFSSSGKSNVNLFKTMLPPSVANDVLEWEGNRTLAGKSAGAVSRSGETALASASDEIVAAAQQLRKVAMEAASMIL
ncbi:hypothetical protein Droror1_Dr00011508 [Drosera rotundifolia]